jgi:hypothetical protein
VQVLLNASLISSPGRADGVSAGLLSIQAVAAESGDLPGLKNPMTTLKGAREPSKPRIPPETTQNLAVFILLMQPAV